MGEIADYQSLPNVDRIFCVEVPIIIESKGYWETVLS